jgi:hypothetical protein
MNIFKRLSREEAGHILRLSLIFMLFGSLTLVPLLKFTFTEMKTTLIYKTKTYNTYTCDSAVEDAAHKLIKMASPLDTLAIGGSCSYTTDAINGRTANVTITKLSLLSGIVGEGEYKYDQPHEGWLDLGLPPEETTRNYEENWVEYQCQLDFDYQGTGNRQIESIGVFISPYPGDIITGPYDEITIPVITFTDIESQQERVAAGGFSYIYRWKNNKGPEFDQDNPTGSISFKFRVDDANWSAGMVFAWATFKEQDISYVASAELVKWLIEASVDDTCIRAEVLSNMGGFSMLSWELFKE